MKGWGRVVIFGLILGHLNANGDPSCRDALDKADHALEMCQLLVQSQDKEISSLKEYVKKIEPKEKEDSLLTSPIFWGIVGLLGGLAIRR